MNNMDNLVCVSREAVGIPDENDQLVSPDPGDAVSFQADGEVDRVEGGMVYVRLKAVNGQPMPETAPAEDPEEREEGELETLYRDSQ